MRIDLHLHSPLSRSNGDAIKWSSLYDSIEKLKNNDIKIAAFSDHNTFDPNFYLEAYELAKTANILLLPAIEVNVVRNDGEIANIIYVFNNNLDLEQLKRISKIASNEIQKKGISLSQVNNVFNEFDVLKIPHVGKSDHFKYEDLQMINYDAIEISNEDHPNYVSVIKKGIDTSIVAFSDTHKWNEYPQVRKLITIIDGANEVSFNELKNMLSKKINYTKRRI